MPGCCAALGGAEGMSNKHLSVHKGTVGWLLNAVGQLVLSYTIVKANGNHSSLVPHLQLSCIKERVGCLLRGRRSQAVFAFCSEYSH